MGDYEKRGREPEGIETRKSNGGVNVTKTYHIIYENIIMKPIVLYN
jgi:hypothetical protein